MFLRIESLELDNIRCFEHVKFNFNEGVNVISGPNGSGKSTIITAIGFGLYGPSYLTGSGLSKTDLIRREEEKGRIELVFTTPQGTYTSRRTVKMKGSDIWKVHEKGYDKPISTGVSSSQEVIERLIGVGIDANTFKTALCARQGELTKLLDDTASERGEHIRKILGLESFSKTSNVMKKYGNYIQQEIDLVRREIKTRDSVKTNKKELEDELEELIKSHLQLSEENEHLGKKQRSEEELIKTLREKRENIRILGERIESQTKDMKSKQLDAKSKKEELDKYLSEIDGISQETVSVDTIDKVLKKKNKEYHQISGENQKLDQINVKHTETRKKIEILSIELQKQEQKINNLEDELTTLRKHYTDTARKEKILQLDLKIQHFNTELKQRKEAKSQAEQELQDQIDKINQLENAIQNSSNSFEMKFQASIDDVMILLEKKVDEKNRLITALNQVRLQRDEQMAEHGRISNLISTTTSTIEILDQHEDHICPLCQRSLESVDTKRLILNHQEILQDNTSRITELGEKLGKIAENIDKMELKLRKLDEDIPELTKFSETKKVVDEKRTRLEALEESKLQLQEKFEKEAKLLEDFKSNDPEDLKKSKLELESEQARIKEISDQLITVRSKYDSNSESKSSLLEDIKDIDINKISSELAKGTKKYNHLNQEIEKLGNQIQPLMTILNKVNSLIDVLKGSIHHDNLERENHKQSFSEEEYLKKESAFTKLTKDIGQSQERLKNIEKKTEEIKHELSLAEIEEKVLVDLKNDLVELEDLALHSNHFEVILNNAPELLIAKTTSNISSFITNMMKRMLPKQGFDKIAFQNDGDVHLYNKDQRIDKNTLSGGEKTVLALSLRLALADFVAPLNFLTLDEPTNHLDQHRIKEFLEIIDREQLFTASKGQLLLVTHKTEFDRNAENSIKLQIVDGHRVKVLDDVLEEIS